MEEKVSRHNIVGIFQNEIKGKGVEGGSSFARKAPHFLPALGLTINMNIKNLPFVSGMFLNKSPPEFGQGVSSQNRTEKRNSSSKTVHKDVFNF